ncbi:MAG: ykuT 1 [Pseudonocardiales bacterium]|nr:ykuT 1 [Pseudonocardiales bacterium]
MAGHGGAGGSLDGVSITAESASLERSTSSGTQVKSLPKYVHEHADLFIGRPLQILLIIVLALILRAVLHRAINRLTRPTSLGHVPRILSPLKERAVAAGSRLEASILQAERRQQRADTIGSVLKNIVSLTLFVIVVLTVLPIVGIDLTAIIAGTSLVGVALAFGAQNVVKDFLSGVFMLLEDQYGVGDVIDVKEAVGTVEAVGLRTTRLRDEFGTVWYVRNGEIVRVGNQSQGFGRVVLDVPISAEADLDAASSSMLAVAQEMQADPLWSKEFLSEPELQGVQELTREETVIRLVARVRPGRQFAVARELRRRIRARFDELNIAADITQQADGAGASASDSPADTSTGPGASGPHPSEDGRE